MPNSPATVQKAPAFTGEFRPLLDGKFRITIPARWREGDAGGELYIIKSLNRHCLTAFTREALEEWGERAGSQAATNEAHQIFKDVFFASAVPCPYDSQGRMVLPEELRRFAGLVKETVLTGSGQKFDIWNPDAWGRQLQDSDPTYRSVLKSMGL